MYLSDTSSLSFFLPSSSFFILLFFYWFYRRPSLGIISIVVALYKPMHSFGNGYRFLKTFARSLSHPPQGPPWGRPRAPGALWGLLSALHRKLFTAFFRVLLLRCRLVAEAVKWYRAMIWAVRANSSELGVIWEVLKRPI